mmetsp:Transcript_13379/g.38059  ORF Transcript_13379/g.38059 Transcript_13379/m.38059 type:complete len:155 (-) Transcript_13379:63-527(-)
MNSVIVSAIVLLGAIAVVSGNDAVCVVSTENVIVGDDHADTTTDLYNVDKDHMVGSLYHFVFSMEEGDRDKRGGYHTNIHRLVCCNGKLQNPQVAAQAVYDKPQDGSVVCYNVLKDSGFGPRRGEAAIDLKYWAQIAVTHVDSETLFTNQIFGP